MQRFQDEKLTIYRFFDSVLVVCPLCAKKCIATVDYEKKTARLSCISCGYFKEVSVIAEHKKYKPTIIAPAHAHFGAILWLQAPFRNNVFWAYNETHLDYLEKYIGAHLRESKERTGFTLVEKLPKFIQIAKNRDALLKLIDKMRLTL